jgi:hypothetical protein
MRLMIACVAAVAAVVFATPSFAQEADPAAPTAKPKVGTTAYCNNLKSTSAKATCLKRVHASAAKPAVPTPARKAKAKKPATESMAAPKATSAQLTPPAAPAQVQQAQPSTIVVPPLPQKTI